MSIFPFLDPSEEWDEDNDEKNLPLFREYAYDYSTNQLLLNEKGNTYLIEGNEALRIWIYKALTTERYHYTAYSSDFGSEHENLIGQNLSEDTVTAELERYIVEALMTNPYIEELNNFNFNRMGGGIQVTFDCMTVYGELNLSYVWKGAVA